LVSVADALDAIGDILRIVNLIEILSVHTYGAYDHDEEDIKVSH